MVTYTHTPSGSTLEVTRSGSYVTARLVTRGLNSFSGWKNTLPAELVPAEAVLSLSPDFTIGLSVIDGIANVDSGGARELTVVWKAAASVDPGAATLGNLNALLDTVDADNFIGYAATDQKVPYTTLRPFIFDHEETALDGMPLAWDQQYSIYCAGASVEASHNLALAVIQALQGARLGGTTLDTSMGYNGAQVEGHYESQVTVQLNQGGI